MNLLFLVFIFKLLQMPLYMDFHKIENITIEDVKTAHIADRSVQDKYKVKYHQFWVNEEAGTVFCLMEGPDKESCEAVHQEAHGNIACALTEVEGGFYGVMMGGTKRTDGGLVKNDNDTIMLNNFVVLSRMHGNNRAYIEILNLSIELIL